MMLGSTTLALRYALFAAVAAGVNIGTQWASLAVYDGTFDLFTAMALGTGTGLFTKYLLDKQWIFYDTDGSLLNHSVKFTLYTAMGVFTTMIFWGTELLFDALSDAKEMRFLGAALGLGIGYFIKYRLDRRFVFRAKIA